MVHPWGNKKQRRELEVEILNKGVREDVTKRGPWRGEMRGGCMQHLGKEESARAMEGCQGCHRQPGRREAAQGLLGFSGRSIMGGLGSNKTALAADGKEMARGMDGSGEAVREGTAIALGPPHHLLFLSSPVCFPLGIISDKNLPC